MRPSWWPTWRRAGRTSSSPRHSFPTAARARTDADALRSRAVASRVRGSPSGVLRGHGPAAARAGAPALHLRRARGRLLPDTRRPPEATRDRRRLETLGHDVALGAARGRVVRG